MEDQEESVSPILATAMTLIKRFAYPDQILTGDLFRSKSASQSSQSQSDIITLYFNDFLYLIKGPCLNLSDMMMQYFELKFLI